MALKIFGRFMRSRRRSANSLEELGVQPTPTSGCPIDLWQSSSGEAKEDDVSIWSMEEIDDNPGPGRLIDKYIYQRLGAMLERRVNRILGPLLASPLEIGRQLRTQIQQQWPGGLVPYVLDEPLYSIMRDIKEDFGPDVLSGLERLACGIR